MIWKNFRRDFAATVSRLVSVVIITAVAVIMYVALSGLTYNALGITNDYFDNQNVADFWISGIGFNKSDCEKLKAIDEINDIAPRVVLDCEDRYDEDITLSLYSMADGNAVNIPLVIEGDFPTDNREIMISDRFAEEHGLQLGDTYEIKVSGTNIIIKTVVSALVKSPECMHHVSETTMTPDYYKYGYAYINEAAVSGIYGDNVYNQICITVKENADAARIKSEITEILKTKVINILALDDNLNANNVIDLIGGIKNIVMIFPIIFFLIAALIMFSTMSRLIENARGTIGTFKALGYSDGKIMLYYLLYAIFVVVLGYILGVIPANKFLTVPIMKLLTANADMPPYKSVYNPQALVVSFIIVFVICIGTAFYITAKTLKENPSQCMRPKPPPKAKKILPEKIPMLWNRLSFTQKYIIRNIFRNKGRMAICIVGIAGCMTLILTAYGISDSIDNYLDLMSSKQHKYDVIASLENDVSTAEYEHIGRMDGVSECEYEMATGVKLYSADKCETTYIKIYENEVYLKLVDVYGENRQALPGDGIVIDEDIADNLGVSEGEAVLMKFPGDDRYYEARVSEIHKGIDYVYAGRSFWRSLGKEFVPTSAYLKCDNAADAESRLLNFDFVSSTARQEDITTALRNQVNTMVTIVYLLILFGGVLALVVLYNLGIMSFYEQVRSLATLMVLGFRDKEIKKLVLSENIIFALLGIFIGLPLGVKLAGGILLSINQVHLQLNIYIVSYLISGLLTFGFALIVNLMLGKKMKNIDMLGALKSVE